MGIEPTSSAWKAEVLPLNYTRKTDDQITQTPASQPDLGTRPAVPTRPLTNRCLAFGDYTHLVEGGGFTPGMAQASLSTASRSHLLLPSALRTAALRATFEIAPGDFVNLHRFQSSPF